MNIYIWGKKKRKKEEFEVITVHDSCLYHHKLKIISNTTPSYCL